MAKDGDDKGKANRTSSGAHAQAHAGPPKRKRLAGKKPTPAQADKIADQHRLAMPNVIELGEVVVGQRSTHSSLMSALGKQQGPRIEARVSGDPAIQLVRAPLYIPGTLGPQSEANEFRFACKPTKKGIVSASLDLTVLHDPQGVVHVPIKAEARLPGEPSLAEQAAEQEKEAAEKKQQADDAADKERARARIRDEEKRDTHYHSGHLRRLGNARTATQAALQSLYNLHRSGIDVANIEVGEFRRTKPAPEEPSTLEKLAWLALDIGTGGLAGALAKRIEPMVSKILTQAIAARPGVDAKTVLPSRALVAFVTDSVKSSVKAASGAIKDGAKGGDTAPQPQAQPEQREKASADPKAAYFETQWNKLANDAEDRALETATTTHDALLPMLKVAPDEAVAVMTAITDGVKAEKENASPRQAEQSVRGWVRYVAHTSGAAGGNTKLDERHPLQRFDGLIDVTILPDLSRPERPVTVKGARILGVKSAVAERIARQRLLDLDLTVRAAGDFNSPTLSVTVLRHANGSIEFTDNTTVEWQRATWFARKAAANGRGRDAEWGARILIENEVMNQPLASLIGKGKVQHDSDEG